MRYLLFIFCLSFSLEIAAQTSQKDLGEFIYTVPLKKQVSLKQVQTEWWNEYVEWPAFNRFFNDMITKIDSGEIQVMLPEYPFTKIAARSEVRSVLHTFDSSMVEDINTGEFVTQIIQVNFYIQQFSSVTFCEEWFWDEKILGLTKKVKGFLVNVPDIDRTTGEVIGEKSLFYVPCDPSYHANEKKDKNSPDIRTIPFLTYDLHFPKMKGHEDLNLKEQEQQKYLIKEIQLVGEKNKKAIADTIFPYTSKPQKKLLKELSKLSLSNGMKFYEEWDFDVNRMIFEKKVKGIVLEEIKTKNDTAHVRKIAFLALNGFIPNDPVNKTEIKIEKLASDVAFANYDQLEWHEINKLTNADTAKLNSMATSISNDVKNGKAIAYPLYDAVWDDPWDPTIHKPKPAADLNKIFTWVDTLYNEASRDGMWDSSLVRRYLDYHTICGFRFFESWDFDLTTLHFEKNIKTMGPLFIIIDRQTGDAKFIKPFYNIDIPASDPKLVAVPQNLIAKNITYDVPIDFDIKQSSGEYMTDGSLGIFWDNSWKENLYQEQKYPLVQGLIDGVLSGKIKAVDADHKPLTPEQVKLKINSMKDSTFIKAGDLSTDYTLANHLQFSEDWYFDPTAKAFYKKVNSITLVHAQRALNTENDRLFNWKENPIFTINLN